LSSDEAPSREQLRHTKGSFISLQLPAGKEVADLWAEADDARLKAADVISGSAVTANLLIEVADNADKKLLR
jgi:hypothetical protein